MKIDDVCVAALDDGTLHLVSADRHRVLNIPRAPFEQRTWQVQPAPEHPVSPPESTNSTGDVVYAGGPDDLLAMFAFRGRAFMAFGRFANYVYLVRIEPRAAEFETVATRLGLNARILAVYPASNAIVIVPAAGDAVTVPL